MLEIKDLHASINGKEILKGINLTVNPGEIKLRMGQGKDGPIITENGNMILDVWMDYIPENTESTLKSITGVLESGLFMNYKVEVLGLTS